MVSINGVKSPLTLVYQSAVVLLLLLASFIGAKIYSKVDELPDKYITLKQYDCDTKELKEGIKDLNRKVDRILFKKNE
jgi:hypothetical protein